MNSFNLTLTGKHFICPSILNDSFAGYSNLGCRTLPFMTLNISFQPLLACKDSFEKSADSLLDTPFQVTVSFSLAALKILSLSLILDVIMMCFGVSFFRSNFSGTLCASQTSKKSVSFARLGKFSFFTFSNKFSISCSSYLPSGSPMIQMLECLKLSQNIFANDTSDKVSKYIKNSHKSTPGRQITQLKKWAKT